MYILCLYHVRMCINIPRTKCNSGYSWPADAPKCNQLTQKESYEGRTYSSWWFQPIWKILVSQIASFRQVGLNIKKYIKPPPSNFSSLFLGSSSHQYWPRNCASIKLCSWSLKGGFFREGSTESPQKIPNAKMSYRTYGWWKKSCTSW